MEEILDGHFDLNSHCAISPVGKASVFINVEQWQAITGRTHKHFETQEQSKNQRHRGCDLSAQDTKESSCLFHIFCFSGVFDY